MAVRNLNHLKEEMRSVARGEGKASPVPSARKRKDTYTAAPLHTAGPITVQEIAVRGLEVPTAPVPITPAELSIRGFQWTEMAADELSGIPDELVIQTNDGRRWRLGCSFPFPFPSAA